MAETRRSSRLQAQKTSDNKDDQVKRKRKADDTKAQPKKKAKSVTKQSKTSTTPAQQTTDTSIKEDEDFPFTNFTVETDKPIKCERRETSSQPNKLGTIFTHGAGGGLTAPYIKAFAEGFSLKSPIVSFEGTMNLKSRVKGFHTVLSKSISPQALGGMSMGARAAVIAAQENNNKPTSLILASYPLRGGTKNDLRDQILLDLTKEFDVLFISGTKDSMCDIEELNDVRKKMKARSWLITVEGADHGINLTPKKAVLKMRREIGRIAAVWLEERDEKKKKMSLRWDAETEGVSDPVRVGE